MPIIWTNQYLILSLGLHILEALSVKDVVEMQKTGK